MNDPIYRVDTEEQIVYLTFDDGPYVAADVSAGRATATTADLLDQLAQQRGAVGDPELSATFFVNGWAFVKPGPSPDAPDQPDHPDPTARRDLARRLLAEGHDLANHSQHHLNPWGLPAGLNEVASMVQEIDLTQLALALIPAPDVPTPGVATVGTVRPLFRSPGDPSYQLNRHPARPLWGNPGASEASKVRFRKVVSAASQAGLRYASYNIWAKDDPPRLTPESVYWHTVDVTHWARIGGGADADLLSFEDLARHAPHTRRGAIIVMHNGRRHTVTALGPFGGLAGIIPYIYGKGFVVRRLPALEAP